mgnify:FL=1
MNDFFKGHWLHWCALLVVLTVLGLAGVGALHVREFSLYLLLVLSVSLGLVLLIGLSRGR